MELFNSKVITVLLSTVAILSLSGCKDDGSTGAGSDRTILTEKMPPVAVAEVTPVTAVCPSAKPVRVVYDGSKSYDPDGEIVSYNWFVNIGGSDMPLSTAVKGELADVCTVVGDKRGSYEVGLTVEDNDGNRVTDLKKVEIVDNMPPQAYAGDDQSVVEGTTVTLDGSKSFDSDGQIVVYQWKDGNTVVSDQVSFTKNDFTVGEHTLTLTVTDDVGNNGSDNVVITVIPQGSNEPPVAVISEPTAESTYYCDNYYPVPTTAVTKTSEAGGSSITLNGSTSYDPDGDPLTYVWSGVIVSEGGTNISINDLIADPTNKITKIVVDDGNNNQTGNSICGILYESELACSYEGICKVRFNLDVDDGQVSGTDASVIVNIMLPS